MSIYLLREREFVKTNENVYKIGQTQQKIQNRMGSYPKGSEIILVFPCDNPVDSEKELIKVFTDTFKLRKDYGKEYFEGNIDKMKLILTQYSISKINIKEDIKPIQNKIEIKTEYIKIDVINISKILINNEIKTLLNNYEDKNKVLILLQLFKIVPFYENIHKDSLAYYYKLFNNKDVKYTKKEYYIHFNEIKQEYLDLIKILEEKEKYITIELNDEIIRDINKFYNEFGLISYNYYQQNDYKIFDYNDLSYFNKLYILYNHMKIKNNINVIDNIINKIKTLPNRGGMFNYEFTEDEEKSLRTNLVGINSLLLINKPELDNLFNISTYENYTKDNLIINCDNIDNFVKEDINIENEFKSIFPNCNFYCVNILLRFIKKYGEIYQYSGQKYNRIFGYDSYRSGESENNIKKEIDKLDIKTLDIIKQKEDNLKYVYFSDINIDIFAEEYLKLIFGLTKKYNGFNDLSYFDKLYIIQLLKENLRSINFNKVNNYYHIYSKYNNTYNKDNYRSINTLKYLDNEECNKLLKEIVLYVNTLKQDEIFINQLNKEQFDLKIKDLWINRYIAIYNILKIHDHDDIFIYFYEKIYNEKENDLKKVFNKILNLKNKENVNNIFFIYEENKMIKAYNEFLILMGINIIIDKFYNNYYTTLDLYDQITIIKLYDKIEN